MGAARAGPEQLQASVLEWVLAPVRGEWATPAWQAHLASPQAFMLHYTPVVPDGAGGWQVRHVGRQAWQLAVVASPALLPRPALLPSRPAAALPWPST